MSPLKLDPNEDAQTLVEAIRHYGPISRQQARERLLWSPYRVHKAFQKALLDRRIVLLCHFHTLRHGNPVPVYDIPPGRQELVNGRFCACIPGFKRKKDSKPMPRKPDPVPAWPLKVTRFNPNFLPWLVGDS